MGVSFDSQADNRHFQQKFDFPYDLLSDEGKEMSIAYGAATSDSEKPKRVSVLIGTDGKVAAAYAEVKPADHPDEVLADLKRLG